MYYFSPALYFKIKMFSIFVFVCFLGIICVKSIINALQYIYYIAGVLDWSYLEPLLDFANKLDLGIHSQMELICK